jgi:hypothetical protein
MRFGLSINLYSNKQIFESVAFPFSTSQTIAVTEAVKQQTT